MKILLVEDDQTIVTTLSEFLISEDYEVDSADGMNLAMDKIASCNFDLVLLDITLNDGNGYSVCRAIKSQSDIPVIFLTASDDEFSVITGLDIGADDYISKPFRPRELLSRIKSVLRRYGKVQNLITFSDIVIDTSKATVKKNGVDLALTALEYRILLTFVAHKDQLLKRNQLLLEIWDLAGDYVNDNTLTVYIKRLREKIEDDPANPKLIKTVRGLGYIFSSKI